MTHPMPDVLPFEPAEQSGQCHQPHLTQAREEPTLSSQRNIVNGSDTNTLVKNRK